MAISKIKLPARDVCEHCLWQIQREIRTLAAASVQSATERSEALSASQWQRSKFGERADCRRWRKQGGERVAAVEKIKGERKPDDFFGHRNRGAIASNKFWAP